MVKDMVEVNFMDWGNIMVKKIMTQIAERRRKSTMRVVDCRRGLKYFWSAWSRSSPLTEAEGRPPSGDAHLNSAWRFYSADPMMNHLFRFCNTNLWTFCPLTRWVFFILSSCHTRFIWHEPCHVHTHIKCPLIADRQRQQSANGLT